MKAWLLSMIGVVFLIAIAEMLLPEGKLRKNIRGIFALILMLAILKPLPYLKNADWNFDFGIDLDNALANALNARKLDAMERDGETYLSTLGYACVIDLQGAWDGDKFVISSVIVTCAEAKEKLREDTAKYYQIEAEKVVLRSE